MATRFQAEFKSRRDVDYLLEIEDSSFGGTATTFTVGGDGFRLQYDAVNGERNAPIIASRVRFDYIMQNATDEGLITDLSGAAEGRFSLRIMREGVLYWVGYIQPEISRIEDSGYPYAFSISATDGLSRLKSYDFTTADRDTFLNIILTCLNNGELAARYFAASTDIFLRTSVDWWHTTHGGATAAKDPLKRSRVDCTIWRETNGDGTYKYKNCYDVLTDVLKHWNARLYMSGGCYRVEQPDYRLTSPFRERRHSRDGTNISNSSTANYDRSLPQNATGAKSGASYDFFPALKTVRNTYTHKTGRNFAEGYGALFGTGATGGTKNLGNISVDSNTIAKISGRVRLKTATSGTLPYYYTLQLAIICGTKELKRTVSVVTGQTLLSYEMPTWQTSGTGGYVNISSGFLYSAAFDGTFDFSLWSPTGMTSGDLTLEVISLGAKTKTGSTVSLTTDEWSFESLVIEVANSSNSANWERDRKYENTNPTTGNSYVVEVDTIFGSEVKPWTLGKIEVSSNGTTWASCGAAGWSESTTGADLAFGQLLTNAILSGQRTPVRKMVGGITGDNLYFHNLISDVDSRKWLFLGGSFIANSDWWDGEWWGVQYTATNTGGTVTIGTTYDPAPPANDTPTFSEKTIKSDPSLAVFEILATAKTGATIASGAVTSVPVGSALKSGAFKSGQKIKVIDPFTGNIAKLTVAATSGTGATSISVTGAMPASFPPESVVLPDEENGNTFGAVVPYANPINVTLQEFPLLETVVARDGKSAFLVPAEWNGLRITEYSCRCPAGTGDINVQLLVNGTASNTMNITGNTYVTTGANKTLATGDMVGVKVSAINTSGLWGLIAVFKIE